MDQRNDRMIIDGARLHAAYSVPVFFDSSLPDPESGLDPIWIRS